MKYILIFIITLICQEGITQNQMYDICPLKVGEEVPNTMLLNSANEEVALSDLINEKPAILVFYRGAWCGYCTKHLSELNDAKAEIEELGYQILGITVDKYQKLDESLVRSESDINVYSDARLETISAFGLDWKVESDLFEKYKSEYKLDLEEWSGEAHHSLPVPAIFFIRDGRVEFQYVNPNYRKRLSANTLLAILRSL